MMERPHTHISRQKDYIKNKNVSPRIVNQDSRVTFRKIHTERNGDELLKINHNLNAHQGYT